MKTSYSAYLVIIILILIFATGCKDSMTSRDLNTDKDSIIDMKETLIEANKQAVKTEDQHIEDFIARRGWNMQTTGTGLRYQFIRRGNGPKAEKGHIAVLNYKTRLITGDVIYSSDETGPKEFVIGKGGVEAGLEEAVLLMHVGDKINLIIPSHLAWGLTGDNNRVPPKSTLIYELELTDLK